MRKKFVFILIITSNICLGQTYMDFEERFENLANKMQTHIAFPNRCHELIRDFSDFEDDIDKKISNSDDYNEDDLYKIRKLRKIAEAIEDFLRTVGSYQTGGYMTQEELNVVRQLFEVKVSEISPYNVCVNLYLITVRTYSCWLFFNSESETKKVSIIYRANRSGVSGMIDMGLAGKKYRSFWNNSQHPEISALDISNVNCISMGLY